MSPCGQPRGLSLFIFCFTHWATCPPPTSCFAQPSDDVVAVLLEGVLHSASLEGSHGGQPPLGSEPGEQLPSGVDPAAGGTTASTSSCGSRGFVVVVLLSWRKLRVVGEMHPYPSQRLLLVDPTPVHAQHHTSELGSGEGMHDQSGQACRRTVFMQ